ncbi:hypothetical protein KBC89_03780, partial [Candidatus Woesebacteria bacterium]|nr:hypothetical protein [Candidatus Woesebacteria bacterium]
MNKIVMALIAIALVAGVGLTVRDYRIWHHLESDKLGQGSIAEMGLSPVQALGLPYSSFVGKFRIKPPAGWITTENESLKSMRPIPLLGKNLTKIVTFKDPNSTAQIIISGMLANTNVTEGSNALATGITRDRQY